ncbi:MAG TPA: rhamnulokinase family protein, partial [Armatimonadota bacterium]|nr:rhamnulokinase family protein [Armatimonadota bacterium]
LGPRGELLGNPYHYRDERTVDMVDKAAEVVPRAEIFGYTGIQFMEFNTVFQLYSAALQESPLLGLAETLLMMPDLFNFWFTGEKVSEFSIISTSQMYDPRKGDWARELLQRLGIPTGFLTDIIDAGTVLGPLLPSISEATGAGGLTVVAPAGHDTGSAVVAVPASTKNYAYISSGTWSLMGTEITEPIVNEQALEYNFTNEGGVDGTYRFLKNIMGLWLVQECRREWQRRGDELSYDEITQLASDAPAFRSVVEPDDASFLRPGDMPTRIAEFCTRTGQAAPESRGEILRCALESLALKYRWVLEKLEELMGTKLECVHIVGGGTQNRLLNQFAANAMKVPVITGPIEATGIGNILTQAMALGHISSLADAREVVRNSFEVETYEPTDTAAWDDAYQRYLTVAAGQ